MFFDDILVYNPTLKDHLFHLQRTLEILRKHQLYAKKSNCCFGQEKVEYLCHLISRHGVEADASKIAGMVKWPIPTTIKSLRGYEEIAAPLTNMLKRNAFHWTQEASDSFETLKKALTEPLVLALSNFSKPFIIECDASGKGIGAVLMQEGGPIAFLSQALKGRTLDFSTYEELLALVVSVQKWRPYLLGHKFIVRID